MRTTIQRLLGEPLAESVADAQAWLSTELGITWDGKNINELERWLEAERYDNVPGIVDAVLRLTAGPQPKGEPEPEPPDREFPNGEFPPDGFVGSVG